MVELGGLIIIAGGLINIIGCLITTLSNNVTNEVTYVSSWNYVIIKNVII